MPDANPQVGGLSPDDLSRNPMISDPDKGKIHIGLASDTYTITVSGDDTQNQFCVIDMHIPPGGGPPPHRHDFEETFVILEGEIEATFRGDQSVFKAGMTVNIPANAPHSFHNVSAGAARLLCICSPAGQEKLFQELGVPVSTRTTPPPKLDREQQAELMKRAKELAPVYHSEFLDHA